MPITLNGTTGLAGNVTGNVTGAVTGNADSATKLSTATGSAPSYACRAWVRFDGTRDTTGATSTANTNRLINASGNVSSVLRNAAGDYTITFSVAMSNSDYSVAGSASFSDGAGFNNATLCPNRVVSNPLTTSSVRVSVGSTVSAQQLDVALICLQVFGN